MGTEIKQAVYICIELILFSLLALMISVFIKVSYNAFYDKQVKTDVMHEITAYANVFEFTSGAEINLEHLQKYTPYGLTMNIKRTSAGRYQNLSKNNVINIYKIICQNKNLIETQIPAYFILKGDDIVNFIGTFGTETDVIVANLKNSEDTVVFSTDTRFKGTNNVRLVRLEKYMNYEKNDVVEDYATQVSKVLGQYVMSDFYCFAVYDNNLYKYDAIVFYRKT